MNLKLPPLSAHGNRHQITFYPDCIGLVGLSLAGAKVGSGLMRVLDHCPDGILFAGSMKKSHGEIDFIQADYGSE